jgi:hypothetical protein
VASPSRVVLALAVAALATGAAVVAGVVLRSPDQPAPARPLATRLASLDTARAVVRRGPFCDSVPAGDPPEAAGDASAEVSSWVNGDPLGSGQDVAHEYGCSWTGDSGAVAAGWVFAPPVTVARAQELATAATARPGCSPLPGAVAFGAPSVALSCTAHGATTLSYRGLFGDAWLVCELTGSRAAAGPADVADLADLADRWCASVLTAAGTT